MPDAIITSTESTFGTISGTFAADQSTVTGTVAGIITGTLTGSVGVPGPAGPQGPQGEPGEGVPAGGLAGQFLQKTTTGVDYATDWVTVNLGNYLVKSNNLSDLTDVALARSNLQLGTLNNPTFAGVAIQGAGANLANLGATYLSLNHGLYGSFMIDAALGITFPDTSVQTTAFTSAVLIPYAPLNSPLFTGDPRAPTAPLADNDTSIATTAFVQQELLSGTANARNLEVYVRNQTGSTIPAGSIVYINGATGNRPTITLAQANNDANSAQTFGFTKTAIANNGFGFVIVRGELENIDTSALTEGVQLYLSPTTPGTWTTTKPSAPQHLVYVGICVRAHPTQGVILVAIQNGYEINELHDVKITSPTNGQVLKYDSAQSLWVNGTDVGGVAWGSITGTLSSQTDLQSALDGKYSTTNPAGYITSAALSPYLTTATASATYQTLLGMADYLSKSGNLAGLANAGTARSNLGLGIANTVQFAQVNVLGGEYASYVTTFGFTNSRTYSGPSGTIVNYGILTSDDGINLVKEIGNPAQATATVKAGDGMVVNDGDGSEMTFGSTGITFPDATSQTTAFPGFAGYATESFVTSQGYITSAALTGYATESWVTSQGYLTSAPVTSVAGRTGAITLSTSDISGLGTLATVNDAPSDGNEYVRKNAAWSVATGGASYITSVSSPLAVSSGNLTVDLSTYAPLASPTFTGTPSLPTGTTAVTQTVGDNSTKVATTAFVIANAGGGGSGGVDVQTFGDPTTSGSFTWTKPAGAKWVEFYLVGGGAGGGSGARRATTSGRSGGAGGVNGGSLYYVVSADSLGSTETVVVGAGSSGGAAVTADDTNGNSSLAGGNTTFSTFRAAGANAYSNGGTTATVSGTGYRSGSIFGIGNISGLSTGGGAIATAPNAGSITGFSSCPAGGGGGAGAGANVTTNVNGGAGGSFNQNSNISGISTSIAGGSGGNGTTITQATAGTSVTNQLFRAGTGGGGGFYRNANAGGTGGDGGWPGGGGGGGGASDNGFNSGAGGNGANGYAVIITYT